MVDLRLLLTAGIALLAIAVPAYLTAIFFGPALGAVIAIFMALGIGGGRWLAARQAGVSAGSGSANRGRARRSKGAGGRDR